MGKLQVFGAAFAVAGLTLLAACGKPAATGGLSADAKTALDAIKTDETAWVADLKGKNVEKVVDHYASDGTFMPPGQTPSHGTDQIRYTWRQMMDDPAFALDFKADRVWLAASGDLAYSRGTFTLTSTDPATKKAATQKGSYVTVWRKAANGTWRALEDIVTPGSATPAAAVATGAGAPPKSEPDTGADANAIRADETQWVADWKARDAAKIAAHYAPDATVMNPGAPAASGTAGANAAVAEALKDPAFKLTFKSDAMIVASTGDFAYSRGTYTQTGTDPKTHKVTSQKGSYVTLYQRQADGSWKAVEDIAAPGYPVANPA
ncbi:MAG TPA: nuclear transport factor 2 family protein [Caulobacteraceae bacterium]|nr:nuclear transport factor 2 family protein [Caulobacteraceae bacterium]